MSRRGSKLFLALTTTGILLSIAGCGRFFNFAEREPWRREAELTCLKSGAVHEGVSITRMEPIDGPGVCGADFPLKVAALGDEPALLSFSDPVRPPGTIGAPNWPIAPQYSSPASGPRSLSPEQNGGAYSPQLPARLAPDPAPAVAQIGPVALKPSATLACPIVSALDRWIADAVQPAAMRWFGVAVVEIKQISAYSCRGMNGNPHARISEHAFGNALDIAAFTLADGRRVLVKTGWRGAPEEQGFLRDVQGAACQLFNTVLAPGSNVYHYDHIHVDLMRRSSGRVICQPAAVSGEVIAARAGYRGSFANRREPSYTGSLGRRQYVVPKAGSTGDDWVEDESRIK